MEGKSVFYPVQQFRSIVPVLKNMGVRPAGKWPPGLSVAKHFPCNQICVSSGKHEGNGAQVHPELDFSSWFNCPR